jgi:hypothetical protein
MRVSRVSGWRRRALVVTVAALLVGHLVAAIGVGRGMPETPYGDEGYFRWLFMADVARTVWMPWTELSPEAAPPAGWARAVVPFIVVWLLAETIVPRLAAPIRLFQIRRRGGHSVIVGSSPLARAILREWRKAGRSVIVVSPRAADGVVASTLRAAFVLGDGQDVSPEILGLAHAAALACVGGVDTENVESGVAAVAWSREHRPTGSPPLLVMLHVDDPFLRAQIDQRIDRFAALDKVQLRLFSKAQISARRLLRDHPLTTFSVRGEHDPRLWVFGFGTLGEEIALGALRLARTARGARPSIVVVDRAADDRRASFLGRWPGAEHIADLRFEKAQADEGEPLCERLPRPTAIYLCFTSDELNLAAAIAVCAVFERRGWPLPPVYLRSTESTLAALGPDLSRHPWTFHFGDMGWVTEEVLFGDRLDGAARHSHERYLAEAAVRGEALGSRRSLRPWILLPEDLKDDNRHVADHLFVKLRDIGCVARPDAAAPEPLVLNGAEIELLARVEHERWMAQRLLAGWRYAAARDDAAQRHPDILPYDQLSEPRREIDRDVVRDIPALLASLGFGLQRELTVSVQAPPAPWAFAEGFERAVVDELAAVARTAPSREVVLWLTPESAMACRVAELALERGLGRVALALTEPVAATLARQPTAQIRDRLFRLLRRASRVVLAPDGPEPCRLQMRLSLDGRGATPSATAWDIDATGRVLARPAANGPAENGGQE